MTEAFGAALLAALAIAAGLSWQSVRTAAIPVSSPDRLVAELRLAQMTALLLATTAGAYIGFAVVQETRAGSGLDIVMAVGFFLASATTLTREPRQALTIIALGFAAHAVLDVSHAAGVLAGRTAPGWYALGCAMFNVLVGAVTYLPLLRR